MKGLVTDVTWHLPSEQNRKPKQYHIRQKLLLPAKIWEIAGVMIPIRFPFNSSVQLLQRHLGHGGWQQVITNLINWCCFSRLRFSKLHPYWNNPIQSLAHIGMTEQVLFAPSQVVSRLTISLCVLSWYLYCLDPGLRQLSWPLSLYLEGPQLSS